MSVVRGLKDIFLFTGKLIATSVGSTISADCKDPLAIAAQKAVRDSGACLVFEVTSETGTKMK